jgi:GT2 family glycosyltransferase
MTLTRVDVSVVVLACGAARTTLACLESLSVLHDVELQLIVVNNGGGAELERPLERFALRPHGAVRDLQILHNQANRGACAGRNQALALARGEHVAFLDNDILCRDPSWLARVIAWLKAHPAVGMVGPRIVDDRLPHRLECAGYAISPAGQIVSLGSGADPIDPAWRSRRCVQAVGNFVAPRRVMEAIGGFDTAFDPFGFENIDCCYRVKRMGLQVQCDGTADLHHVGHVTTGSFENGGRTMLFGKSLLLRQRWIREFRQERRLYEELAMLVSCSGR